MAREWLDAQQQSDTIHISLRNISFRVSGTRTLILQKQEIWITQWRIKNTCVRDELNRKYILLSFKVGGFVDLCLDLCDT